MAKKHKSKERRKSRRRRLQKGLPGSVRGDISPAAQELVARIARSGPRYLEDNFIRIMQNCHVLREEPELRDLYFNVATAAEVTGRIMTKYEKQMEEVARASEDERHRFSDDLHIEIIDQLVTPEFRQEALYRLDRCRDRLMKTEDTEKLEMVFFVRPLLETKDLPWGLCGLILAIYQATMKQAEQQRQEELELLGEFLQAAEQGQDLEEVLAMMQDPARVAEITKKLIAKPGLRQRLEQKMDRDRQAFEQSLLRGEVKLDLFTEEELARSFHYLAEYIQRNQIDVRTVDVATLADQFAEFVRRSIGEIATSKRIEQMKAYLKQVSTTWLSAGDLKGGLLEIEIVHLNWEEPSQDPFLYKVYVGQGRRLRVGFVGAKGSEASSAETGTRKDDTSEETTANPSKRRDLIRRVTDVFRRR